jgi:hypothetical protein
MVEVTTDSLFEAAAQGLLVFRANDWIGEIGHGRTVIMVKVRQPEVEQWFRWRFRGLVEGWQLKPGRNELKNRQSAFEKVT